MHGKEYCRLENMREVWLSMTVKWNKDDLFYVCSMNEAIKKVYSSFISDEIANYNSSVYYSNPDYIKCSYEAGYLLD